MDSIRNIISNLYIYKFQNVDNLNMKKFGKKYQPEDSPSKEETIEKMNQEITANLLLRFLFLFLILSLNFLVL